LLLMELDSIPVFFLDLLPIMHKFSKRADSLNLSKLELSLGFVNSIKYVDRIIIGIHNTYQLKEIISSTNSVLNIDDHIDIGIVDPYYLNPSNWLV